ncbi:hypothetical protein EYV94_07105 [Puteibacter caeruleilacunae]|nr:hypothetical protein EYV94_07105 [Puteibacter caeruleilacunae]
MKNTEQELEFSIDQIPEPEDIQEVIFSLMVNPNLAPVNYFNDFSEEAIDPSLMAGDDTNESGIFEIDGSGEKVAMTTHAMHKYLAQDPQQTTELLVSKAARKMVCFGAKPVAVSAFLYHINVADVNGQAIASGSKKGLENVAEAYGLKISDRKIRFDNAMDGVAVPPTLIISMLGEIDDKKPLLTPSFKNKGNNIFVIGRFHDDVAASEYLQFFHEMTLSTLPVCDIDVEKQLHEVMDDLHTKGLIESASPVGVGGLFFSLLRAGMPNGLGFDITTDAETRKDAFLFGEAMGRLLVGVNPAKEDEFLDFMSASKIPFFNLGHVTRGEIRIDDASYGYVDKMAMNIEA